jgi:hypothetical protein
LIAGFPINIAGIRGGAGVEPPVMSSGFLRFLSWADQTRH